MYWKWDQNNDKKPILVEVIISMNDKYYTSQSEMAWQRFKRIRGLSHAKLYWMKVTTPDHHNI